LESSALNKNLYTDYELFAIIKSIVDSYVKVNDSWFTLYKKRAYTSLFECKNIIQSLAEGRMVSEPQGRFVVGTVYDDAEKSIKQVVSGINPDYWKSRYANKGISAYASAISRGATVTRIFVQPIASIQKISDVLQKQVEQGIEVLIVLPEEVHDLLRNDDYILVDDKILDFIGNSVMIGEC